MQEISDLEWNVVLFGRRGIGHRSLGNGGGCRRGSRASTRAIGRTGAIAAAGSGIKEGETFEDYTQATALLPCLLVVPLIEFEAPFYEKWTALLHILSYHLGLPAKGIHVHESDFLFGFSTFVFPG